MSHLTPKWGAIGSIWPINDFLVAITVRAELLVWTHRSGHFRHKINLGRHFNGGGCVFNQHFLCLVIDQSIVVIGKSSNGQLLHIMFCVKCLEDTEKDIRQSKDEMKIERKQINARVNATDNSKLMTEYPSPRSLILFDQQIKANDHYSLEKVC